MWSADFELGTTRPYERPGLESASLRTGTVPSCIRSTKPSDVEPQPTLTGPFAYGRRAFLCCEGLLPKGTLRRAEATFGVTTDCE